jgi:type IV secretion system protein TrbL
MARLEIEDFEDFEDEVNPGEDEVDQGGDSGDGGGDSGGDVGGYGGSSDSDGIGSIIGGLGDVVNGPPGGVSYLSDPWGNTFETLRDASEGLSGDVLPALTDATLPDLSAEWFISAYRVSFAAAIFLAVALLFPQFIRTARGRQSGRELIDSLGLYFGTFLLGAIFGPAAGMMLVTFFHSLSDVFVSWGIQDTVDNVTDDFQSMISATDPADIAGGMPIAVLLMLGMLLGLFLVLLMLVLQFVALYFTGVLIPLGLVWIIDPTRRSFGLRLVGLWLGILAAQPLLFFLLGVTFTMMDASTEAFGANAALQSLVELLVAVIALFIAALSPLLLLRLAPSIPVLIGGSTGPSTMGSVIGAGNISDATDRAGVRAASPDRSVSAAFAFDPRGDGDASVIGEPPRAVASLSDAAAARSRIGAAAASESERVSRAHGKRASMAGAAGPPDDAVSTADDGGSGKGRDE